MSLVDSFWAAPPLTRTWAAAVFCISIAVHAGIFSGGNAVYIPSEIFKFPPQIWRLPTSFCITSGLGIVFDPYMIWTYAGWLERDCPRFSREPGKFFVYTMFVGLVTLLINSQLWGAMYFTHPLLMAIMYTWCQENRGRPTNIYFITLDARLVWPAFLFFTFLTSGWFELFLDLGGIVAAHLYDFLTVYWPSYGGGPTIIRTPGFVSAWFNEPPTYSTPNGSNRTGTNRTATQATAATTGFSSWNSRGQGRRLGGD